MSTVTNYTPAYTPDDIAKLEKINAWLNNAGDGSRADLSRITGIKEATRSSILNGSYASSPTKWLDKLLTSIAVIEDRADAKADIPYALTSISKLMIRVCYRVSLDKDFGVFIGRVGVGKTTALREYHKANLNTVLVEAFEGIDHSTFITELSSACGIPPINGTASAKTAKLINALKGRDISILCDEANHLPRRSFGALRRISDVAGIGVVLIGTQELLPMVQDPDGRFGQISSRIGYWPATVKEISKEDAKILISSYLEISVDEPLLKAFYDCCEGSARTLRNLLRSSWRKANKANAAITPELVKQANQDAMGGRNFIVRS